jgi:hypothetical protein
MGLCLLGEREEVLGVAPPQFLGLARVLEPLGRVLADRLQHPEALLSVAEKALVDEILDGVQVGLGDILGVGDHAAAGED